MSEIIVKLRVIKYKIDTIFIYLFYFQLKLSSLVIRLIDLSKHFLSFLIIKFLVIWPIKYCQAFDFFYSDHNHYMEFLQRILFIYIIFLAFLFQRAKCFFLKLKTKFIDFPQRAKLTIFNKLCTLSLIFDNSK